MAGRACGLRGVKIPEPLNPADLDDRNIIRAYWDIVEQNMRDYVVVKHMLHTRRPPA